MTRVDCTFHLTDFQVDSPWGEEEIFFITLYGEGMALEFPDLEADALQYLIGEIESGMTTSEHDRQEHEIEELLYKPPESMPVKLQFVFSGVGSLQALYQPPDHLWEMVFDDIDEENSQAHIMMSTQQVRSLLEKLKHALLSERK